MAFVISTMMPVSLGWVDGSFLRTLICVPVIGTLNVVLRPDDS